MRTVRLNNQRRKIRKVSLKKIYRFAKNYAAKCSLAYASMLTF